MGWSLVWIEEVGSMFSNKWVPKRRGVCKVFDGVKVPKCDMMASWPQHVPGSCTGRGRGEGASSGPQLGTTINRRKRR